MLRAWWPLVQLVMARKRAPVKVSRFRASQDSLPPVDPRAEDDLGAQATRDLRPGTDDATVRTLSASQSPFDVIGVKVVRSREKTQYELGRVRRSIVTVC